MIGVPARAIRQVILLGLLCSLLPLASLAQVQGSAVNQHLWLAYFGDHPVSERWQIHLDAQWRRHDLGLTWQQLLVRPAINYKLNEHVLVTGGYVFVDSFRYGEFPRSYRAPEHRVFEQLILNHGAGTAAIQHRFRVEQRLLGQRGDPEVNDINTWQYQNRFRYFARAAIPLGSSRYYLALSNEAFANFANPGGRTVFDQNRAYAGIGFPVARATRLEFAYMMQTIQQPSGTVFEHNNTLQISIFSNLSLFGNKNP